MMSHELEHHLRRRAAAALRPAGPALYLVSHGPGLRLGFRAGAITRAGAAHQPGTHPAAAVDLRARAVLLQPVFLLRLQPHHHARHFALGALPAAPGTRDRTHRAVVRPRPRSRAGAPGRRHAEFSPARRNLRAHAEPAREFSIE